MKPSYFVLPFVIALLTPTAYAVPTVTNVAAGSATVDTTGTTTTIQQTSPNAIINWSNFDIAAGNSVNITQRNATSALLNRVSGGATTIAGALTANGRVFIVNPAGISISSGANINVGALVASTLAITDTDFMNGNYRFTTDADATGAITNASTALKATADGGTVALLGANVTNSGTITARLGTIIMASGADMVLDFAGDGLTSVVINSAIDRALVANTATGKLIAEGGNIVMSAQAASDLGAAILDQQGFVQAEALNTRNGRVVLDGGAIGLTQVTGTVDATSLSGIGGSIIISGQNVALLSGVTLNATGSLGGGTIQIGASSAGSPLLTGIGGVVGDIVGGTGITAATHVWIAPHDELNASGTGGSNGGTIALSASDTLRVHGTFTVSAGASGGNGGTITTTAPVLQVSNATMDASAAAGTAGQWQAHAAALTVCANCATEDSDSQIPVSTSGGSSFIVNTAVDTALNNGTSVTLSALPVTGSTVAVSDTDGALTVQAPITKTDGADAALSLIAQHSITINPGANITSSSGALNVTMARSNTSDTVIGSVGNVIAPIDFITIGDTVNGTDTGTAPTITTIWTNGGAVTIGGNLATGSGSLARPLAPVTINSTSIDTRVGTAAGAPSDTLPSGAVTITGGSTNLAAIALNASTIQTTSGAITLTGAFSNPTSIGAGCSTATLACYGVGVYLGGQDVFGTSSSLITTSGAIAINGLAFTYPGPNVTGVWLDTGATVSTQSGTIDIRGVASNNLPSTSGSNTDNPAAQTLYVKPGSEPNGLYATGATISTADKAGSISLSGSTDTNSIGLALVQSTVTVGAGGTLTLRALNSGNPTQMLVLQGNTSLSSTNGTLNILPGGLTTDFRYTAANTVPISVDIGTDTSSATVNDNGDALIVSMGGASGNNEVFQNFHGFSNVVIGTSTHTGTITVGAADTGTTPTYNFNLTLENSGAGSGGIVLPQGISVGSNTLALITAGTVSLGTSGISASALLLGGGGVFDFGNVVNHIQTLALLNAGNVSLINGSALLIGPVSALGFTTGVNTADNTNTTLSTIDSSSSGNVLVQANDGNITLGTTAAASTLSASGTIDLIMFNGVFNNTGGGSLVTPASWRMWASTYVGENRGGLQASSTLPNLYGCTYSMGCSWSGAGSYAPLSGNQFIYAVRPTLDVVANDQTRGAGTGNPALTVSASGLVNGDTNAVLLGSASTNADANSGVGQYAITSQYTAANGYLVNNVSGTLTVTASVPVPATAQPTEPLTTAFAVANAPLLRSGLQALFTAASDTSVYQSNLNGVNVCVSSETPILAPGADSDIPWAERDWKLVRSAPNLNSCIAFNTQHGCNQY